MTEPEFIRLYESFADALFRHCYFRVYERERARDLVQETFSRTWEYLAEGNEVKNTQAFLYKVANNLIIDESRKKKAMSLDELNEQGFDPPDPNAGFHRKAEINEMIRILDRLESKHRDLLVMRYVDGLGPKEIAEIVGETENVISVRLHRAVERLKKLMHEQEPGEEQ